MSSLCRLSLFKADSCVVLHTNSLGHRPHNQAAPTEYTRDAKPVVVLGEICSDTGLLPNSVGSLQGLKKLGEIAVASGGTTDTWRGVLDNEQVALKAFRIYTPQDLREAKKILWKSVPIWKRLNHENLLPFRGVDTTIFELALVYDWGHNKNIVQYLESHPEASRPKLVTILSVSYAFSVLNTLQVAAGRQRTPIPPCSRNRSWGPERGE